MECEDGELTYGELNARANRLAHHLRGSACGPEVRVALCLERTLEMVVGLLGVLKAGGAYVPLDPAYPAERLAFMLEDSAPVVVLMPTGASRAVLPALDAPVLPCSTWTTKRRRLREAAHQPRPRAPWASRRSHLAYVIYTSGSTGRPRAR